MKAIQNIEKKIRVEIEEINSCIFYYMNYYGDYRFDEYLSKRSRNIEAFCDFVNETLLFDKKSISRRDFGCATFTARNMDGDVIFARNNDCECAIPMMIRLSQGEYYKSLALLNMTDANAVYPVGNNITLPDYALPRLILNKAKTVDEAILYAQKYNYCYIVSPLHYMVADTAGNSAVIEFVNGKMVETKKNVIPGDEQWSCVYNLTKRSVAVTLAKNYTVNCNLSIILIQQKWGNCALLLPSGEDRFGQSPYWVKGLVPCRYLEQRPKSSESFPFSISTVLRFL